MSSQTPLTAISTTFDKTSPEVKALQIALQIIG
jgi:hypothetical protein